MISENNVRVMVTMPKDLQGDLLRIANEENRTLSNLIVTILKTYINDTKEES